MEKTMKSKTSNYNKMIANKKTIHNEVQQNKIIKVMKINKIKKVDKVK